MKFPGMHVAIEWLEAQVIIFYGLMVGIQPILYQIASSST
jgi:hypothetical protein